MKHQPRIHLCYSEKHFQPGQLNPETEWFSCSQLAMHMWRSLRDRFPGVTYGDTVPDEPLDLLWTNRPHVWKSSVFCMAVFASIGHYAYVTRQVLTARKSVMRPPAEGVFSLIEQWQQWLTLARSNAVLAIGNKLISQSFAAQKPCGDLHVIDCGIDTEHFKHPVEDIRGPVFVHNATRFSVRKGSHLVGAAWPQVVAKFPDAKLLLLGRDGDVDITKLLQDVPNVVMSGAYSSGSRNYVKQLSGARWVVLPSLAEGQAGTLLEAMSCGCVPIASRDTGVDTERYGGYVLEPNTSENLVATMLKAASDWTHLQAEHVRQATLRFHSWKDFELKFIFLTEKLLAQPTRQPPSPWKILMSFLAHQIRQSTAGIND